MNPVEKRRESRLERAESLYIEVLANSTEANDGLVVKCQTEDISNSGLKANSNFPITVGAYLELLVSFDEESIQYLLAGEVKWCNQINDEPTYQCGFELLDAEHSDIEQWRELFME